MVKKLFKGDNLDDPNGFNIETYRRIFPEWYEIVKNIFHAVPKETGKYEFNYGFVNKVYFEKCMELLRRAQDEIFITLGEYNLALYNNRDFVDELKKFVARGKQITMFSTERLSIDEKSHKNLFYEEIIEKYLGESNLKVHCMKGQVPLHSKCIERTEIIVDFPHFDRDVLRKFFYIKHKDVCKVVTDLFEERMTEENEVTKENHTKLLKFYPRPLIVV
jgi:hypothetical protein